MATGKANAIASKFELISMEIQNLRGFEDTRLSLSQPVLFFVGPNNAGKTSLLRLLDVVFNWELDHEFRAVSDDLLGELLPARDTRNAARRLTLNVRVADGRRRRSLPCDANDIVQLRLSLTVNDRRLRANLGAPRRNEQHDENAQRLLDELRSEFEFVHIPAGRSVDSPAFNDTLLAAMTESLTGILQQPGKGATKAERDAQKVVDSLEKIAVPVEEFWTTFLGRLPHGWVRDGGTTTQVDRGVLARFVVERLAMRLTTGLHDATGVPAVEVGAGLQSLLDLELRRFVAEASEKRLFLAVEEPEVFLHPSAQRYLGRLLASGELATVTLVSTHSPLVVEEARFEQLAVVRDHMVSQPKPMDETRASINGSLLAGRGSEVLFARSVLLVEGPGDEEYFEALRRRLAPLDRSGSVDQCYVLGVGGNNRFAPSIRLLRSYEGSPFVWTVLLDGDGAEQLREAMKHVHLKLSARQETCLGQISTAIADNNLDDWDRHCRRFAGYSSDHPVYLAPVDLERIMCAAISDEVAESICDEVGVDGCSRSELAEVLGTKNRVGGKAIDKPMKSPWIRGAVGRSTPAAQLDRFVIDVLERWVSGASDGPHARELLKRFVAAG